jgi:hypothetical protein
VADVLRTCASATAALTTSRLELQGAMAPQAEQLRTFSVACSLLTGPLP